MPPSARITTRSQRRRALKNPPTELKTVFEVSEEVVTFTDISFSFPLPPVSTPSSLSTRSPCRSPSLMSSSAPSSPDSQDTRLPLTPSSSDEDLPLSSPTFKPRRVSIKPLVISKFQRPAMLPSIDHSEESDAEDSDSEWYTREFSNFLTISTAAPHTSLPAAHRDSFSIAPTCDSPLTPYRSFERRRRRSSGLKSSTFDDITVPNPHTQFLSPKCAKTLSITPRRPPPRMSIPDDACSAFSVSLYTDDVEDFLPSPLSMYSQESASTGFRGNFEGGKPEEVEFPEDFEVQVDHPLMLPLSLPGTPIDLETDIANGLEELWLKELSPVEHPSLIEGLERALGIGFILEDDDDEYGVEDKPLEVITPQITRTSPPPSPRTHRPTPSLPPTIPLPPLPHSEPAAPPRPPRCPTMTSISSFSLPPSPTLSYQDLPSDEHHDHDFDERRHGLKSKWSSSTLGSVREEHAATTPKFAAASKLKMYFQGQHKRSGSAASTPTSAKFSIPSPVRMRGKDKKERGVKRSEGEGDSDGDVLVIGFSNPFSPRRSDDYYPPTPGPPPSPRHSFETPTGSPRRRPYELPDALSPRSTRPHPFAAQGNEV
ncbi:hypothetical protein NP233_g9592 [Leucocoprinus birnbaumii]|uniref:Uncharacterized protein n=1 Tax=Leucocoprinus birnbaumii TaxID=56174 RepID=A0AAD5VK64_9AGAR|nr:hypothetical protein NP233_g9592 [Leucocoprinus birnbaumii]